MDYWWEHEPQQRYWLEANSRADVGDELFAPVRGSKGQRVAHYELVQQVRPGDIVLHWKDGIVATSVALGPLTREMRPWASRADGSSPVPVESWVMPLIDAEDIDPIVTLRDVRSRTEAIFRAKDVLERVHNRSITNFPFVRYAGDTLRAFQGYLSKFPIELFEVLAPVGLDLPTPFDPRTGAALARSERPASGGGFMTDALLRSGIEQRAVNATVEWYERRGATNLMILGKPYDLDLVLEGRARRVEVKGSSRSPLEQVLLTRNEVAHARSFPHTDLVVVDGITVDVRGERDFSFSGGKLRRWADWAPESDALAAMQYEYRLPEFAS